MQDATWDDDSQVWHVTTSHGNWEARILVGAMGPFSEPAVPNLPGLASFQAPSFTPPPGTTSTISPGKGSR